MHASRPSPAEPPPLTFGLRLPPPEGAPPSAPLLDDDNDDCCRVCSYGVRSHDAHVVVCWNTQRAFRGEQLQTPSDI